MPWMPSRGGGGCRQLAPCDACQALTASLSRMSNTSSPQDIQAATEYMQSCLRAMLKCLESASIEANSPMQEDMRGELREVLSCILSANVPSRLLARLCSLEFEAQKDVVRLFGVVVRLSAAIGEGKQVIDYLQSQPEIAQSLVDGCGRPEVALHCGFMLRSLFCYPQIAQIILASGVAEELVTLARNESFDISSDAFSSLRELVLTHKAESAAHIDSNFTKFFTEYHLLLASENYVTQRQALRLLGELLLNRGFKTVMMAYVANEQFLQIHMNLLRQSSKAIQIEAFHVLKIFVVNPRKPPRVHSILYKNRERLVKLLETFYTKKVDDEPFAKDLKTVIQTLENLQSLPKSPASSPKNSDAVTC
jgi:calcium binding protein 39